MSGETTTIAGKTFDETSGETVDLDKLNRLGLPSIQTDAQSIGDRELIDGSITADKLDSDITAQINADATLGDGSVTSAKLAAGAVTYVKLNQDVLDKVVTRDTILTTVGSFLKYSNTAGETEEATASELAADVFSGVTYISDNVIENDTTKASNDVSVISYATVNLSSYGVPSTANVAWVTFEVYQTAPTGGGSTKLQVRHPTSTGIVNRILSTGREDGHGCASFKIDVSASKSFDWALVDKLAGTQSAYTMYAAVTAYA